MASEMRSEVVKSFTGATQALAEEQFAADAIVAARLGYAPTSQTWDGTTLTVVYERLGHTQGSAQQQEPEDRATANARANQERAEANARANQERAAANARANQGRADTASSSGTAPLSTDGVAQERAQQDRDPSHQEQIQ